MDWWLVAFLPLGSVPAASLTRLINAAYSAAEDQDGAAMAAEGVLQAVPEGEADVIRAQLARVKLSGALRCAALCCAVLPYCAAAPIPTAGPGCAEVLQRPPSLTQPLYLPRLPPAAGGMVDGRLLAAFRALYETAAAGGVAGLDASWSQHLRGAVARRCREILAGMPSPLLDDLAELAAWEQQSGQEPHGWASAQRHYAAGVEAYEARHGSMLAAAQTSPAAADAASSSGDAPLLDAGADAALAQVLLAQAQAQSAAAGAAGRSEGRQASSGDDGDVSTLPLIYRCYKKLILADAILLSAEG